MANYNNGSLALKKTYDSALTAQEIIDVAANDAMYAVNTGRTHKNKLWVQGGDSMSVKDGHRPLKYMDLYGLELEGIAHPHPWQYKPMGRWGKTLAAIDSEWDTNTSSYFREGLLYDSTLAECHVGIDGGTNDVGAGTTLAAMQTLVQNLTTKAVTTTGYNTISFHQICARDFGTDDAKILLIDLYNQWIITHAALTPATVKVKYLPDELYRPRNLFASDALYIAGNNSRAGNLIFFDPDGVHLSLAGADLKGRAVAALIATL